MISEITCPVCASKSNKILDKYVSSYSSKDYTLYQCENCDMEWWEPLEMPSYLYEQGLFTGYEKLHSMPNTKLGSNHRAFFTNFKGPWRGKLLDVGCGNGKFLMVAKSYGFEVWGIEIDAKSAEIAKRVVEGNIYNKTLEQFVDFAMENNIKFDVITFFEVLEHQDKPMAFLERVGSILRQGGYIAGSVPNRKRWLMDDSDWDCPPHHLLKFSKSALEHTLNISGFTNTQVISLDFSFKLKEWLSYVRKDYTNALPIPNFIRDIVSIPLSLLLIFKLKDRGPYLYFQGLKA